MYKSEIHYTQYRRNLLIPPNKTTIVDKKRGGLFPLHIFKHLSINLLKQYCIRRWIAMEVVVVEDM
jgi:hypothetical protein